MMKTLILTENRTQALVIARKRKLPQNEWAFIQSREHIMGMENMTVLINEEMAVRRKDYIDVMREIHNRQGCQVEYL